MASGYGVFRHPQSECRTIAVCLRDQSTRGEDFLARSLGSGSQSREGIVTLRAFYLHVDNRILDTLLETHVSDGAGVQLSPRTLMDAPIV